MREHVKEYEEAVVVLKENTKELKKIGRRTHILRALFASTAILGTGALIGHGSLHTIAAMLPAAAISSICFLMPEFKKMKVARDIKTGKYFEGKNYHQIVDLANVIIDRKNEKEAGRSK